MARIAPAPYQPERISPPGDTIRDILEDVEMSQAELARRMGRPVNKINQIVRGKKAVTADTALELESVLGLPASFWLNREQNYQLALSQQNQLREQKSECEIARQFPCAEMARLGWIERQTTWLAKYQELLRFFASAKLDALNAAVELAPSFRKAGHNPACQKALAAWLRKGVIESQKIDTGEFAKQRVRDNLEEFRALTMRGPEGLLVDLPTLSASLGIAVVFVPHLEKTYVGGAAFWHGDTPVVQLSYRWKRHDILWFNFFHELGHILLHSRHETYLDDFSADNRKHEQEANAFAGTTLIPADAWAEFFERQEFSPAAVKGFAKSIAVSESVIAGRLHNARKITPATLQRFVIPIPG